MTKRARTPKEPGLFTLPRALGVIALAVASAFVLAFSCSGDRVPAPAVPVAEPVQREPQATKVAAASPTPSPTRSPAASCAPTPKTEGPVRFAVIGDYGYAGPAEQQVAALVKRMDPAFVITTGDNNYVYGEAATIDANIGQYFHEFICPYVGRYGAGATTNRFFPSLGNHDWETRSLPYLDYFVLPGNERYYDFVWGDVHLFAIDSDPHEPDGITATSRQAAWLKTRLTSSKSRWQIVYMHHPPYSSGSHGSSVELRWPYAEWGADLVLAGHDHHYERVEVAGTVHIVNGLGGRSLYAIGKPIEGSVVRYNENYGAQLIEASATRLVSRFVDVRGKTIDERVLGE